MKDKVWEFEFEGRQLRVTNRFSFFPPRSEELLEVDGHLVAKGTGGWLSEFSIIQARVEFAGVAKQVEIRIAARQQSIWQAPWRLWTMGCHILIDGLLVGGDTTETLVMPEVVKLAQTRTSYLEQPRQFIRRLLVKNILTDALPITIFILAFMRPDSLPAALGFLLVGSILLGGFDTWLTWRSLRSLLQSEA